MRPFPAILVVSLVAPCLAAALCGQSIVLTEPATPLLPHQFGAWLMVDAAATGTDAGQIDAARAGALKEDTLSRFASASYRRAGSSIDVQALQFMDATGASAALSLYRAADRGLHLLPAGQKLGTESSIGPEEAVFRAGNTVVIARGPHLQPADLQPLAISLPKIGGPRGLSPMLPTLLPSRGLDAESVRYSVGPTGYAATSGVLPPEGLGFEKAAESVTANYTLRSGKGTVTMLLYPTPQIAGDHGRAIESWINAHHEGLGTVKLRREGPLVLMTTGSFSPDDAQQMIENIHLRGEVTWEKPLPPAFHAEVRKTASLLTSIAVLSGVLMTAAVLLGLFLGAGRAGIRVLLGKPAAAEAEFLGLGLQHGPVTPIHPEDGPARV